jgi:hypothetical protein
MSTSTKVSKGQSSIDAVYTDAPSGFELTGCFVSHDGQLVFQTSGKMQMGISGTKRKLAQDCIKLSTDKKVTSIPVGPVLKIAARLDYRSGHITEFAFLNMC